MNSIEKNIKILSDEYKLVKEINEIISFILKNNKRGLSIIIND